MLRLRVGEDRLWRTEKLGDKLLMIWRWRWRWWLWLDKDDYWWRLLLEDEGYGPDYFCRLKIKGWLKMWIREAQVLRGKACYAFLLQFSVIIFFLFGRFCYMVIESIDFSCRILEDEWWRWRKKVYKNGKWWRWGWNETMESGENFVKSENRGGQMRGQRWWI